MAMASRRFRGLGPHGFHSVAYTEWGVPQAERTVICVHGLSRNGRDFDSLATLARTTAPWSPAHPNR